MLVESSGDDLASLVETRLDEIDENVLARVYENEAVMDAVRGAVDKRMVASRDLLLGILDAGELLEMDRRLVRVFKDGLADASFLAVLNMNAEAARGEAKDDASEQRARVMEHLYTRAQEEWEKRIENQANAVLHRLTRTEQPVIRRNILEYYLAPQTEIFVPNGGDPIPLDKPIPPRISCKEFSDATTDAVAKLKQFQGANDSVIQDSVEQIREIAKEARLVIMEHLPPEDLASFEQDLMETFASS